MSSDLVSDTRSWFNLDSPVLETDVGLVHLCFVSACIAIITFRSSSQGFNPRMQLLLWISFASNLFLKKITLGYWWTWCLFGAQSILCILFLPSLRKQGILMPNTSSERAVLAFILGCCFIVGIIHYEKTLDTMQQGKGTLQHLTPYMGSLSGLLGGEDPSGEFHTNSRNALTLAHSESVLRSYPGLIAFLVGFKRSLEGLAILPQYRQSLTIDGVLDWRVYSWSLSLGLYHLSLASMYFGRLHIVTLTQCGCWLVFVVLSGSKIGVKVKDEEFDEGLGMSKSKNSYWNSTTDDLEQKGLCDDDVMDIL